MSASLRSGFLKSRVVVGLSIREFTSVDPEHPDQTGRFSMNQLKFRSFFLALGMINDEQASLLRKVSGQQLRADTKTSGLLGVEYGRQVSLRGGPLDQKIEKGGSDVY